MMPSMPNLKPMFMHRSGKTYAPSDPDYVYARLDDIADTARQLMAAVVDIQHRLSELDGKPHRWPGDVYEPGQIDPSGEADQ